MTMRRLTASFMTALMVAVSLHVTAQPVAADTMSVCAQLAAIEINIQSSGASQEAKDLAIAAVRGAKRFAGCTVE